MQVEIHEPLLIQKQAVLKLVSLGKTKLSEMVEKGEFPAPISAVSRPLLWKYSDVKAWVERV